FNKDLRRLALEPLPCKRRQRRSSRTRLRTTPKSSLALSNIARSSASLKTMGRRSIGLSARRRAALCTVETTARGAVCKLVYESLANRVVPALIYFLKRMSLGMGGWEDICGNFPIRFLLPTVLSL